MAKDLPKEDHLVRMQRDLKRAQKKKPEDVRWGMVIDLAKCMGCHVCTIACVVENKLPPGVVHRVVLEEEVGHYPAVRRRFTPRPCVHCQNPPCTKVCPVTATYKTEQGAVIVIYERCIGCCYCLVACPYAARTSDFGEWYTGGTQDLPDKMFGRKAAANGYEARPAAEYGKKLPERNGGSPKGNACKCHFCLHRLAVGQAASKKMSLDDFKAKHSANLKYLINPDHPDLGPKNNQFCLNWGRLKHGRSELLKRFVQGGLGSSNAHGHTLSARALFTSPARP